MSRTPTQSNVGGASKTRRVLLAGATATPADLAALAARRGWTLSADVPRGHWTCRTLHWTTGPGSRIAWIEEHKFGICLVEVEAGDGEAVTALAASLRPELDLVDEERLLESLATTDDPWILLRGLPALAFLSLPVDEPRCLRAFEHALAHPIHTVRRAALGPLRIRGIRYQPWPGLRALVEARLPHETALADRLSHLLTAFDRPAAANTSPE